MQKMDNLLLKKGTIKSTVQMYLDNTATLNNSSASGRRHNYTEKMWKDSILFSSKCEYCIFESPISGLLTLTRDCLIFEPDMRDATVIDKGSGNYQVHIDIGSIYECACINAPIHSSFLENYDERINLKAFLQVLIKKSDLPDSFKYHSLTLSNKDATDERFITRSTQKIYNVGAAIVSKISQIADYVNVTNYLPADVPSAELNDFIDPHSEIIPIKPDSTNSPDDGQKNYHYHKSSDPIFVLFGFFDIELVRNLTVLIMDLLDDSKIINSSLKRVTRLVHSSNSLLQFWLNENRMPDGWISSHSLKPDQLNSVNMASVIEKGFDSNIFNNDMINQLQEFLPHDCAIRSWKRCFSTYTDGVSLLTLYRNLEGMGSCVIVIEDTEGNVFGCFTDQLISSSHYYGTLQVFIYKFEPKGNTSMVKVYHPSSNGRCIIFSNESRISIGGDEFGKSALTIYNDFYCGNTDYCSIFKNPPLSNSEEFLIKHFEVWAFVDL